MPLTPFYMRLPPEVNEYLSSHPELRPSKLAERLLRERLGLDARTYSNRTSWDIRLPQDLVAAVKAADLDVVREVRAAITAHVHKQEKV